MEAVLGQEAAAGLCLGALDVSALGHEADLMLTFLVIQLWPVNCLESMWDRVTGRQEGD